MKKLSVIIVLSLLCCTSSFAQRFIPGQWEVSAGVSLWKPVGGDVTVGKVGQGSKMLVRLSGLADRYDYVSGVNEDKVQDGMKEYLQEETIDTRSVDFFASWGYVWCLAHTRSRSFNVWLGGVIDAGVRTRRCYYNGDSGDRLPGSSFLYGVSPELSFEYFPAARFSVSAFIRPALHWYVRGGGYASDRKEDVFNPSAGLQFHFYL